MDRLRALVPALFAFVAAGCSGDGCLEQIPNGFPPGERMPNALQLRVSQGGLDAIEDNVGALAGALVPGGLTFPVPPSCGGNPEVCCGLPVGTCSIALDLAARPGDSARLELAPGSGAGDPVGMTMRARVRTASGPLRVRYEVAFVSATCDVHLNTEAAGANSVTVRSDLRFSQDPTAGTTRVAFGAVSIDNLDKGDIDIDGGLVCDLADFFKGFFIGTVRDQLESQAGEAIEDLLCKPCETNEQCAPFGTCDGGTCRINDGSGARCLQELGVSGRLATESLLPGFGADSSLDLYLVAGGYADGRQGGLSLGFAAGARSGSDGPTCAPDAPAPSMPPGGIPAMSVLDRNDTAEVGAFDFALGVHRAFLDRAAWAFYQSGLLCASLDTGTTELLNSDTLALLMPSMVDLLHDASRPVAIALRPQAPPTVELGGDTLLALTLPGLEMDFFLMIDERYVRLFTARLDLRLPLDLEVDSTGAVLPVLGDVDSAFDDAQVTTTGLLEEPPDEIAGKLGVFGGLAVPMLTDALGAIELPALAGMTMNVPSGGIRALDGGEFLALFGSLELAPSARRLYVDTRAEIRAVHVPDRSAFAARALRRADRPSIQLALGGAGYDGTDRDLEWQLRLDGGTWSPYTRDRDLTLSRDTLWLAGHHTIEVRARHVGDAASTDPTPVLLVASIDPAPPRVSLQRRGELVTLDARDGVSPRERLRARYRFGGGAWRDPGPLPAPIYLAGRAPETLEITVADEAGNVEQTGGAVLPIAAATTTSGGCVVASGSEAGGALALTALIALALAGGARRRALLLAATASAVFAACTGTVTSGGDGDRPPDQQEQKVVFGQWSDIAVTEDRVLISAYEQLLGDLVIGEVAADGSVSIRAIDGVPDEAPSGDVEDHRGGVAGAGPDVGAWTSLVSDGGRALVAYQDRDAGALKIAIEEAGGWRAHVVDATAGVEVGRYASLVADVTSPPGIAYLALGADDGAGGALAELRWAQASTATPSGPSDWTIEIVASTPVALSDSPVVDLPPGTGLFASAARLPDGRPAVAYYQRATGSLHLAVRDAGGWVVHDLDGGGGLDAGRFASLVVAADGTAHVAYQEARSNSLRYLSFRDGAVERREVVDDGRRATGTHAVGASARLVLGDDGRPQVFYQDSFDVDLLTARRSDDGTWMIGEVMTGPVGYGFYVAADRRGSQTWVSTHSYDRAFYPPGTLAVTRAQ